MVPRYVQWTRSIWTINVGISGIEVINIFPCSTFFLLVNVKMPTLVGILTFMSRKNSIISLSGHKNLNFLIIFILMSI